MTLTCVTAQTLHGTQGDARSPYHESLPRSEGVIVNGFEMYSNLRFVEARLITGPQRGFFRSQQGERNIYQFVAFTGLGKTLTFPVQYRDPPLY